MERVFLDIRTVFLRLLIGAIVSLSAVPSVSQTVADTVKTNSPVTARDSASGSPFDRISVAVSGAHYYQANGFGTEIDVPPLLRAHRLGQAVPTTRWGVTNTRVTDNPLYHGASFLDLAIGFEPLPGVSLNASFVGESRGISYGVADTRNMIVYPRVRFSIDTAVRIWGERVGLSLTVGDIEDRRIDEGLTIYNMNTQGTSVGLAWRSLRFSIENVGDAVMGIGLNIDDAREHSLALVDLPLFGRLKGSIRGGLFNYKRVDPFPYSSFEPRARLLDSVGLRDAGITLSGALSYDEFRVYGQWGLRSAREDLYSISRSAWVVGMTGRGMEGPLEWSGRLEYRYYGGLFNAGFRNDDVYYRDSSRSQFENTIGPYLYSLDLWERPFSQWAVFTEYQDLKEIHAYTARIDARLRVFEAFRLRADLDFNVLDVEGEPTFLYPFYTAGIVWEPVAGCSLSLSRTNRAMNLDNSYPTLYLYRGPSTEVDLRYNIR